MLSNIEPYIPNSDHSPNHLRSWAKKTGFVSTFSTETTTTASNNSSSNFNHSGRPPAADRGGGSTSPSVEIDPILGRTRPNAGFEIQPDERTSFAGLRGENKKRRVGDDFVLGAQQEQGSNVGNHINATGDGHASAIPATPAEQKKDEETVGIDIYPGGAEEPPGDSWQRHDGLRIGLRDNPGFVPLLYYSLQHYLSLAGSLIFIPLIIVPTMGGTDKDTATVISTMLMVSGVTTILHSYFGTRLPLVQGSSFVYLAPALVIMNAQEYRNLTEHYLRGISIFGHRLFRIYAVPMSVIIIWVYAFFLTAGGAYSFKGCDTGIPSSNILVDACRKHAYTMQQCRTDVSSAWRTAAWVRIPYPFQWGAPVFNLRTSLIMVVVSLVASVDSVGIYHFTSLLVSSKPPTPGIVSRGIALEGLCSILAGLWGSGTGSTTLTENIHTINMTKVANRRTVVLGAVFLILFSFLGKVGAILASIPQALAAAILCFIWGLIVALGLSTLQYTQTASFRNIAIVGVSLFLGMSIPAYFQQYDPKSSLILPSYLIPYSAASVGPVSTGSKQFDFAMNALMSLNMVVTFIIAFVLDNTVPGSRQERGVYIWSRPQDFVVDPSLHEDYSLPGKVDRFFCWARCLRA
ncbi:Nucleobase-ascorbate transporter 11 [Linum perenne]